MRLLRRRFAMALAHWGCSGPGAPRSLSLRMWWTSTSMLTEPTSTQREAFDLRLEGNRPVPERSPRSSSQDQRRQSVRISL